MDINKLLSGIRCNCGQTHSCDIQAVYIERHACNRLPQLCDSLHQILLVADENTFSAAGEQVQQALAPKKLRRMVFPGAELLIPNESAIEAVTRQLAGIELIIGIGSGVIQDLCKYVSFQSGIPYIIVATAPSMDGYASNGAAMILGGMKVTCAAGLPMAILADTEVIRNAPTEMLQAGYGDIIGKFSALNDWKLSQCINGEYFCDFIYELTMEQIQRTLTAADGIRSRDERSIKTLMEALVIIGIMMSFAGSSRPASGSEHHLSHFFEITGILTGTPYFSHGIDVAFSTVITAGLREKLLSQPFPQAIYRPAPDQYHATIRQIYHGVADDCIALQKKAGHYAANRGPVYHQKEADIRAILAEMPSSREIQNMLAPVALDMQDFRSLYGSERIHQAILYGKELKDRYTVLWMNYDLYGDTI